MESGWNVWVWLVGVVSRRWVWLVGVGRIYGCGCKEVYTVFPRIDRVRTIYFSALIGTRTNRGRGLIEGAVYYCD